MAGGYRGMGWNTKTLVMSMIVLVPVSLLSACAVILAKQS
jgi:hypothetical protein